MKKAFKDMMAGGDWYFWDEIPWANGINWGDGWKSVECHNRSWLTSMRLNPPDMSARSDAERMRHALNFHGALRQLGGGHVVWIDEFHEREKPYPMAIPANRAAFRFEKERAKVYNDLIEHFTSRHYLSVQWRKPPGWLDYLARWVMMPHPGERQKNLGPALTAYMDRMRSLERSLGFVGAEILEGDNLASYLHDTISMNRQRVCMGNWEDWIAPQLVDMPVNGNGALTIGAGDELHYVVAVSVHSYPRAVDAGMLDGTATSKAIAELPITYRRITRIAVQSKAETVKDMERLRIKTTVTREGMVRQMMREMYKDLPVRPNRDTEMIEEEVEAWLTDLARSQTLRCQSTTTFLVYHRDPGTAMDQAKQIADMLRDEAGLVVQIQWLNALESFLGTVPGASDHDYIRPYVNTLSAAALSPLAKAWGGTRYDDLLQGPPLLIGATQGTTRMHMSISPASKGLASHGLLTGPSGSGKSAVANAMSYGMLKYEGGRVFRIDKGRSALVSTLCAGGVMIDPVTTGVGFQPLRFIGKASERRWCQKWLLGLVKLRRPDLATDPKVDEQIKNTLEYLGASFEPDDLTMSAFVSALGHEELKAALRPYTRDGSLGYLFDSVDKRSYDADWITVELDELLEDPDAAGPLMAVLWRQMMRLCRSDRPMLIIIDEAWMAMAGPFLDLLKIGMRTFRRENARVVFSTQSAKDLADSDLAKIVLNACSLRIFFPDLAMKDDDVAAAYVACGVETDQIEAMTKEFRRDEARWCLLVQSDGSRVLHLDMDRETAPESYWMCCATNSEAVADARRIEQLPGDFLDNFLEEKLTGRKARGPVRIMEAAE
jgi:type IV secretion system protein VirB4